MASGVGLDEFLESFEGVPREKCVQVLKMAHDRLMDGLPNAATQRVYNPL